MYGHERRKPEPLDDDALRAAPSPAQAKALEILEQSPWR
jgi:hypothetical protein